MLIPRYWSEQSEHRTLPPRRSVTVHRFGWSSISQAEADAHATARVAEAWSAFEAGRNPSRRELRGAYAGADGSAIREEVLWEDAESGAVATRNAYGAVCLNVPDILFADVDLTPDEHTQQTAAAAAIVVFFVCAGFFGGLAQGLGPMGWVAGLGAAGVCAALAAGVSHRVSGTAPPTRGAVLAALRAWCEAHNAWRVEVYRTPAGLRLLATHAPIDPRGEEARAFFDAVHTDPRYRHMCEHQACYRARLTPKPWRIGIPSRIGFRAWPVRDPDALSNRHAWVRQYDASRQGWSACAWMETVGTGSACPGGERVLALHDRESGARAADPKLA